MEPLSYGGTFTMERILGTFPVEADGSAYAELPALRSLIFVALDENDLSVKRMQSFVTLQPGERQGCVGCHEQRVTAPLKTFSSTLTALKREASRLAPIEGVPEVIDFPHDIQPIFNQRCLDCHDYDKRKGGVILTGDRGPYYTHSYYQLFADNQVVDGRNLPVSNLDPRTIGSSASPLMKKIDGSHHDVKVTDRETKLIRLWIETGAPHAGTYAALGSGQFGAYYANRLDRRDLEWPSMQASVTAMGKRCGSCHVDEMKLPTSPSDDLGKQPWIPLEPNDPRRTYSRHLLYNLTRPEKSLILLAALSSEAGGYADGEKHEIVFKRVGDPDYQAMLAAIRDAKSWLDENKRFDMPGFRPRDEYVREMKRYGVIAESIGEDDPIDYYAAEEKYWRSLWYRSNQPPDSSQESE